MNCNSSTQACSESGKSPIRATTSTQHVNNSREKVTASETGHTSTKVVDFRRLISGEEGIVIAQSQGIPDSRTLEFSQIRSVFGNDAIYDNWKQYAIGQNVTVTQLRQYKRALSTLKAMLGTQKFQQLLTRPFGNDINKIIVQKQKFLRPGVRPKTSKTAYHGFVKAYVPVENLKRAVWDHGNDYGKGRIGAPYTTCSKIKQTLSPAHVIQQIVLDVPGPDKMTQNNTRLMSWGGLGKGITFSLIKDDNLPWPCGIDKKGTTFHANDGHWLLLPLSKSTTLVWYATQSNVHWFNAPDSGAIKALKNNIKAFVVGAKGRYGK